MVESLLEPHRVTVKFIDIGTGRLPSVVMEDVLLDGLSRERILVHVETLLTRRFGVEVKASIADDPTGEAEPLVLVHEGEKVRAQGWLEVQPQEGEPDVAPVQEAMPTSQSTPQEPDEITHGVEGQTYAGGKWVIFCVCGAEVSGPLWNEHLGVDYSVKSESDRMNSRFD